VDLWTLHFDGLCEPRNPGGWMGWGWHLAIGESEELTGVGCKPPGPENTNNVAEYFALGFGLAAVKKLAGERGKPDRLEVRGDSQLVIRQVVGDWECRKVRMLKLRDRCRALADEILPKSRVAYRWVPREQNGVADELSRRAYFEATGRMPPERQKVAGQST
jgi:ribonuclease HI